MKLILTNCKKCLLSVFVLTGFLFITLTGRAQICANPATTIYGLSAAGFIYPINVANANVGAAINPAYPGNAPSEANAMGYNPTNGRFYYFKRNSNMSPQEFCAFDPGTMTYSIRASCPTTYAIHCGCVTNNGLGYYALDVNGTLFYYNILSNTWTTITNNIRDGNNNDVSSIIRNRPTGDLAIDGNGCLWMLCCSGTEYGLYKLYQPPTTAQATVTVSEFIPPNTPNPNYNTDVFAGIGFNPTGQIYLSTYYLNRLYRLENNFSLTSLGTFNINNVGNDLTSCAFPLGVLPARWENFTAAPNNNQHVLLNWTASSELNRPAFHIEHNDDGVNWETIGTIQSNSDLGSVDKQSFTHYNPGHGIHQYRIKLPGVTGEAMYSEIRTVNMKASGQLSVWPNPAKDLVYIQSKFANDGGIARVKIFGQSGKLVKQTTLQPGANTIDVSSFSPGFYMIRVELPNGENNIQKLLKQ